MRPCGHGECRPPQALCVSGRERCPIRVRVSVTLNCDTGIARLRVFVAGIRRGVGGRPANEAGMLRCCGIVCRAWHTTGATVCALVTVLRNL